ncbi:MAG: response regulator [Planctomycetota bacterium]|jgi:CheY-like chemotaxis protein
MPSAENKTVLVVDDEPDVREYLASILRDARFNVLTAADGEEALEIARRDRPDFISLDLVMPRKSGQKVLYELRKDKALSRIPVLIVTAHARDEMGKADMDDLLADKVISGPGVYLEKPVRPADYVRFVQRALGIEETPDLEPRASLKEEVEQEIAQADPSALRRALAALKAKDPKKQN